MPLAPTTFLTLDALKTWLKITPGQAKSVASVTRTGTTATATIPAHGFRHGDTVTIAGAGQAEYNGPHTVAVVDSQTVTFRVSGSPASPATGTITAQSDQDAVLTLIADRVCHELERATSRVFALRSGLIETHDGDDRPSLFLRAYPVALVLGVRIDDVEVDAASYVVDPMTGRLKRRGGVWPRGIGNVTVMYDAGYPLDEVPPDVSGVALEMAAFLYDRWTSGTLAATAIAVGGSTFSVVQGLPSDLRRAIAQLRDTRAG